MFFSPFIALRYLKPKRTFVSIITLISVMGVALGVFVYTIVMAVFTGFLDRYEENILGIDAHIQVSPAFPGVMYDIVDLNDALKKIDNVEYFTPYVQGPVVLDFEGKRMVPHMRAIIAPEKGNPFAEALNSKIAQVKNPEYDPETNPNVPVTVAAGSFHLDHESAVIGDGLAKNLDIEVGDVLKFYSPSVMNKFADIMQEINNGDESRKAELDEVNIEQFTTVTGIFDSGDPQVDNSTIFLGLETGQIIFGFTEVDAHGFAIRTDDPFKASEYRDGMLLELGMGKEVKAFDNVFLFAIKNTFTWPVCLIFLSPVVLIAVFGWFFFRHKLTSSIGVVLTIVVSIVFVFFVLNLFDANERATFVEPNKFNQNKIETWAEVEINRDLFNAIAAERQMMNLILFAILIVAGFCIMNTMVTVAYQKRSEIGLLKAIGARESQIVWLFVIQGMIVGAIGVLIGLVFGKITLFYRDDISGFLGRHFGLKMFDPSAYRFEGGLPAVQTWQDTLSISITAFVACTIASAIPAFIAANLQPAKALRSE